jgi:DNA-binding ferritin-like protein
MSKSRKTPEQRLADAETAKMIAEFDILAERAAAAGMPAKQVRAIRCALDLLGLLEWGDEEIEHTRDHIADLVDEEVAATRRYRESLEPTDEDGARKVEKGAAQ